MQLFNRNMFISIGAIIILALAIVAFVFIPALGQSQGGDTLVFGKWNGIPVEYTQDSFLVRQFTAAMESYKQQNGETDQYTYYSAMQNAYSSAIIRLGIFDELKQAGYTVPVSMINEALIGFYTDSSGRYSNKVYSETSELVRATQRRSVTEELTVLRYVSDVLGSQSGLYGFKTSSKEMEHLKTMAKTERSFTYVAFPVSDYPDFEVIAFAKEKPELFLSHNLSVITFDTEETAKRVAASVLKNEVTFDDALAAYSTRVGTDGSGRLQAALRADINTLFADAEDLETVLALTTGQISKIVKAGENYAIVRCDGEAVNPDLSSPEMLSKIREWINANEKGRVEDYIVAKARTFAEQATADGLTRAARDNGLTSKTTVPFALNVASSPLLTALSAEDQPELAEAANSEAFFRTAFTLKTGQVSEPILLGSNVLVLSLNEEKTADPQMTETLPMMFNYYANSWKNSQLSDHFLSSSKHENNFFSTYMANFLN